MPLENSVNYISDLNPDWPLGGDHVEVGDDHIRETKKAVKQTFPNITGAVNYTETELNTMKDNLTVASNLVTVKQPIDMQAQQIRNIGAPSATSHAATLGFVSTNFQAKTAGGDVAVTGTLNVAKNTTIGTTTTNANFTVNGDATLTGGLTTNNGTVKSKNLHATDSVEVDGILTVGQLAQFKDGINVTGTTTSTHYRATGNSQFDDDVGMKKALTVNGDITGTLGLRINGTTHLGATTTGTLGAGTTNVAGDLGVTGQTTVVGKISAQSGIDSRYGYFNGQGDAGNARQGCHIVWNERVGDSLWSGATSFVNNYGNGNGGFLFRNVNGANTIQRGEWGMAIQNDVAYVYAQGTNGRTSLRSVNGHSMDWYTGIGTAGDGSKYVQFGLDGDSKGINFFSSDIKFKEDVRDVEKGSALATVDKLRSVSYRWKDAPKGVRSPYGVIAQEVREVMPELIQEHDDGSLALNPLAFIGTLLAAIKDLKAEVDALKAKV